MHRHPLDWARVDVPSQIAKTVRIVAWTILVVLCGAVFVSRFTRCRAYRSAVDRINAAYDHEDDLKQKRYQRSKDRIDEIYAILTHDERNVSVPFQRFRNLSLDQVAQLLNDGKPLRFETRPIPESPNQTRTHAWWIDPEFGNEWTIYFLDNRLTLAYPNRVQRELAQRAPYPSSPSKDRFESFRRLLVGFHPWQGLGPPAWLLILAVWKFSGPFRKPLSELLLASSLICTVFWMAHPNFAGLTSWRSIFSNDSLLWAALMLFVSVMCVRRSYRSGVREEVEALQPV